MSYAKAITWCSPRIHSGKNVEDKAWCFRPKRSGSRAVRDLLTRTASGAAHVLANTDASAENRDDPSEPRLAAADKRCTARTYRSPQHVHNFTPASLHLAA